MPALDFPATPALNQLYPQPPVVGQPVYTWDGAKWTTGNSIIQAMGEPSNAIPRMDGDPAEVGTEENFARGDHRHPVDVSRAPIASPHFIGVPTAPTPLVGDNDEKIATTAFVTSAAFVMGNALPSNSTPNMNGNPAPGTSILYSRDDHIHPVDATRAPLNSPVFTGVPEAPTAAPGTNNTQIATTAFVDVAVLAAGAIAPSDTVPPIDSGAGAAGVLTTYARGDHVHPAGPIPPSPATVNPVMDSTAAVGVATKYAREDHVHPSDTTKVSQTAMDTALAGKSNTGHTHTSSEVTNFAEAVDDRVGSLLVAGTNIVLDYNDTANTLTVTSTAAGGGGGTGDVVGPTSAVNDRIATFSGTSGKLIKDSGTLVTAVQPLDAELTAIAGLVSAADRVPYFTGVGAAALTPLTPFARTFIDDVDAAAVKTTLGIAGTALTAANDTNVQLTTGGSASTSLLAAASITAGWSGTLSAARGGFGANVSAQSGVPLFATGVATFTGTNGTGNFVRTDSPVFTGNPTSSTAISAGDNDTTLATTAFLTAAAARADMTQSLTAAQQLQVRKNVYAAPFDAMAYNGMQINGSIEVSQELGSAGTIGNAYAVDGWTFGQGAAGAVVGAAQGVSATKFPGFQCYLFVNVATAKPALVAGDYVVAFQPIEGYRILHLSWGTANAQPITISFWSAHHRTGLYSISVTNGASNRSYAATYTQAAADVAQYNTITIPGDTTGTWNTTFGVGIYLYFAVAIGTSYTASSANTWLAGGYLGAPGQVNGIAATSDLTAITGVTVFPGSQAPTAVQSANIMRPYGEELMTCKRYWQKFPGIQIGNLYGVGGVAMSQSFIVAEMRAAPTVTFQNVSYSNCTGLSLIGSTPTSASNYVACTASGVLYCIFDMLLNARL